VRSCSLSAQAVLREPVPEVVVQIVCEKLFSRHTSCSTRSCSPRPLFDLLLQLRSTSPRCCSTFPGQEVVLVEVVLREMVLIEVALREPVLREGITPQELVLTARVPLPKTLLLLFPHVLRTKAMQTGLLIKDQ